MRRRDDDIHGDRGICIFGVIAVKTSAMAAKLPTDYAR